MIQFILLLLTSFQTQALEPNTCRESGSDVILEKCIKEFSASVKYLGSAPEVCNSLEGAQTKGNPCPPLTEEFTQKSKGNCNQFISDKGGYGIWGNEIVIYLDEQGEDSIFFDDELSGMKNGVKACPAWAKMDEDEKKHFWVWTMASIANIESSCTPTARGYVNPNGVSVGLLQLDERVSFRKWRGPNCGAKNITNVKENLRCGMDIMAELLRGKEGEYKSSGEIWGSKSSSYWNHLRKKDGGDISELITQNPFCNL